MNSLEPSSRILTAKYTASFETVSRLTARYVASMQTQTWSLASAHLANTSTCHSLCHIGFRLRCVVMTKHFLNKVSNLCHGHTYLEHMNDKGFKRIVGSLVGSYNLLFKFPITISRDVKLQIPLLGMKCTCVPTIAEFPELTPNGRTFHNRRRMLTRFPVNGSSPFLSAYEKSQSQSLDQI